jgi:hypothetical protein
VRRMASQHRHQPHHCALGRAAHCRNHIAGNAAVPPTCVLGAGAQVTGDTRLHRAARAGDAVAVGALLAAGADVNATNGVRNPQLHPPTSLSRERTDIVCAVEAVAGLLTWLVGHGGSSPRVAMCMCMRLQHPARPCHDVSTLLAIVPAGPQRCLCCATCCLPRAGQGTCVHHRHPYGSLDACVHPQHGQEPLWCSEAPACTVVMHSPVGCIASLCTPLVALCQSAWAGVEARSAGLVT